jgi:hypothetical protein
VSFIGDAIAALQPPSPVSKIIGGTGIEDVTASGTTLATATPVQKKGQWTVVAVTPGPSPLLSVSTPADAEVGDVLEFHITPGQKAGGFTVWCSGTQSFNAEGVQPTNSFAGPSTVRMVYPGIWMPF